MFINKRQCNSGIIIHKEQIRSRVIKLFIVSIRPYYMHCKLSNVIMLAVYIPSADTTAAAAEHVQSTMSQLPATLPNFTVH